MGQFVVTMLSLFCSHVKLSASFMNYLFQYTPNHQSHHNFMKKEKKKKCFKKILGKKLGKLLYVSIQSPSHKKFKFILGISLCILVQPLPVFINVTWTSMSKYAQ